MRWSIGESLIWWNTYIEKHFGGINVGDLGTIISYIMHLTLLLKVNFNVHGLPKWRGRYESQNISWNIYICGQSCICGHHVLKDFCTTVINEVYFVPKIHMTHKQWHWVKKESLVVGYVPRKTSAVAHCFYKLELLHLLHIRDSRLYRLTTPGWTWSLSPTLFRIWLFTCWSRNCDNGINFDANILLVYDFSLNTV